MLNQINIQDIVKIAKDAGKAIMEIYVQDFDVKYKHDKSPLTIADTNANKVIEKGLNQLAINFPILSEEGVDTLYEERKHWEYFWLVDPLDGTKEFIKKNGEFTVNIAMIHKNTPVIGVVYAPALEICYYAKKNQGSYKDGERMPLKKREEQEKYIIVASRSHLSNETKVFIDAIKTHKDKEVVSIGSSLKICLVAEGQADIYPRLSPTMEWDTAAAHVIAIESGKKIEKYNNQHYSDHSYNKKSLLNDWFVVR